MLAYILAVLVGTGSVGLYIAAFFFPEIHRKQDFIWSGVGFFYALTLWIYARQSFGGIVVGQTASVALLGWLAWQTLKLRRQLVPSNQQTPIPSISKIQQQVGLKPIAPKTPNPKPSPVITAKPPVSPSPIEAEKASISFQLKPPVSPSKPLGQPVKPPAPSERPQAEIIPAPAIVAVPDPIENSSTSIDPEPKSIEPVVTTEGDSQDGTTT